MKLLLASKSVSRRRMLDAAQVPYVLADTTFDEEAAKAELRGRGVEARTVARALARLKAQHVTADAGTLVLGADQTLEQADGSMLDKPASRDAARAQLRSLSGRTHQLHSAAALVEQGTVVWEALETVTLAVRPLSEAFLTDYIEREYDSIRHGVGGYRIEGPGVQLFDNIEGSHFAILGLPVLPLLAYLREREVVPR